MSFDWCRLPPHAAKGDMWGEEEGGYFAAPAAPLLFFWIWRMRYRDGIREDLKQNRKRLDL